jgi:hypothetical protein
MSFKDKTFCISPDCKNECGRKMSVNEIRELQKLPIWGRNISQAYFCGDTFKCPNCKRMIPVYEGCFCNTEVTE